jgi:hypothetical protein
LFSTTCAWAAPAVQKIDRHNVNERDTTAVTLDVTSATSVPESSPPDRSGEAASSERTAKRATGCQGR